ncbi:MAG: hypothetical protein A4E67_00204 [Syntrophaceae bacterium PtaB.Bin038]|nr:MAG: hypothetical protein A4E67_00204 [Syntrophaceae bacterium PtaB.Bin038]
MDGIPQGRDPFPRPGRNPEDFIPCDRPGKGFRIEDRGQIGLVDGHDDVVVPVGRQDVPILRRQGAAPVQEDQDHIGRRCLLPDAVDALLLGGVRRLPDAGGVHVPHRDAPDAGALLDEVPRGSGQGRHDGPVLSQQAVEQARLAHVCLPRDDDPRPLADHAAFAVGCRQRLDPGRDVAEPVQERLPRGGLDAVLFLEVDLRLEQGQDVQDGGAQLSDPARQVAPEMRKGEIEPPLRAGRDHFLDGLGLGEIEAAVEKGPARELPRFGGPGPGTQNGQEDRLEDERTSVAVDFEGVFAGEGAGGPHERREDLVQDAARGGTENLAVDEPVGAEGLRRFARPEEGARDPLGSRPAGPHDPDAARAGRCGDRRDGVCLGHRGLGL